MVSPSALITVSSNVALCNFTSLFSATVTLVSLLLTLTLSSPEKSTEPPGATLVAAAPLVDKFQPLLAFSA